MDDLKVIIWIIIGVVYLLARRKKESPPPPAHKARPVEDSRPEESASPAPQSFEDLLKEIQQMKQPKAPQRRLEPEPEVVDYDENLGPEERDLEDVTPSYKRDDSESYRVYEEAKALAFHRPSLEETVKLEDTIVRFKQFKGYEKESRKNVLEDYVQELRDPRGFKRAFVLSEILRPKF